MDQSKEEEEDMEMSDEKFPFSRKVDTEEQTKRLDSIDYEVRFIGHCNTTTDIKEANFLGKCNISMVNPHSSIYNESILAELVGWKRQ